MASSAMQRTNGGGANGHEAAADKPAAPPSPRQTPGMSRMLATTANLANLLPTGTLLAFQMLAPVFTSGGECDGTMQTMTIGLLAVLAISCFASSLTDSIRAPDGHAYHGIATMSGIWLLDYPPELPPVKDTARYRLSPIDFIHGVLSVLVFAAVALRDNNVVGCLYPSPGKSTREVLNVLPLGVGIISSMLFTIFPTRRHGFGHPVAGKTS